MQGPPVQLPDGVPAPLAHVVTRLLSRDPAARYASAAETAAALDAASGHDPRPVPASAASRMRVGAASRPSARGPRGDRRLVDAARSRAADRRAAPDRSERGVAAHRPVTLPIGATVAYVAPDATGVQQIWVQTLAGGTSVQITNGTEPREPARGGCRRHQILFAVSGQGIWIVPATGGTPTRLIERGTNPNMSRDGSRIVFEDRRIDLDRRRRRIRASVRSMASSRRPTTCRWRRHFRLTDRRSRTFIAALGPNGDFWTIPAAGGVPTRLTYDLREGGWPVWTSGGDAIVVSSARAGSRTLWQIPVHGGEPSPLTTGAGEDDQPELAADGRQVAYTNVRNS